MSCTEDADFALALHLQEEENRLAAMSSDSSGLPPHSSTAVPIQKGATAGGGWPSPGDWKGTKGTRKVPSPARPSPPPGTSLVDKAYELIDPTPDIYQLFRDFDKHFFWGKLGGVELKWSPRMTRCAGVCSYQPASGLCSVRLSQPLLTLRPRSDLVETLLHEMIHALLFVTHHIDNREEHGPEFHRHMHRINKIAGTNITVYHTFHDEVEHMLTHWWRCTGPCRQRRPHFGFVKRSMNRAPGKSDFWWRHHQASCGGTFMKIKEPEGYGKKKGKKQAVAGAPNKLQDIRNFAVNGRPAPIVKKPAVPPNGTTRPVSGRPGGIGGRPSGSSSSGGHRTPTVRPPATKPPSSRPPTAGGPPGGRPDKRPAPGRGGSSSQKRPPADHPTGLRPNIGTVSNGGNQRVNNITNNVHGFQKTAGRGGGGGTATAPGSRTVTVPPRRGGGGPVGDGEQAAGGGGRDSAFTGQGHRLGGAQSVPWYRRDPPPSAAASAVAGTSGAAAASTGRPATGIFCSPEAASKPVPSASEAAVVADDTEPTPDTVACPVCGKKVSLQTVNDHVDLCLAAECERVKDREAQDSPPDPASDAVWDDDVDELMLSQAADELESSLVDVSGEGNAGDDQPAGSDVSRPGTSRLDGTRSDRGDLYNSDSGAALRSSASNTSTVYDTLLDGAGGAAALSPVSDTSTVYDEFVDGGSGAAAAAGWPTSRAVYGETADEPIVIETSDDEEDYASQRANLSDVIMEFIKIEESDEEMFDE